MFRSLQHPEQRSAGEGGAAIDDIMFTGKADIMNILEMHGTFTVAQFH